MTGIDRDALHRLTLEAMAAARTAPGGGVAAELDGWLLVDSQTGIAALNQALPTTPRRFSDVEQARRWFTERGTGFRVTARLAGDYEFVQEAQAAGWVVERSQPLMARLLPLDGWPLPGGVRVAAVTDAQTVASYLAVREDHAKDHPPDEVEGPFILALAAAGRFRYFFAEEDGVPIASAMSFSSPPYVSVSNVFVRPACRNRGIGAAMTAFAINSVPGAAVACLEASRMGEPVYRRMGFEEYFRYVRLAPPGAD